MRRLRCVVGCYLIGGMLGSSIRWVGWGQGGERRQLDPYGIVAAVLFTALHRWPLIIARRW